MWCSLEIETGILALALKNYRNIKMMERYVKFASESAQGESSSNIGLLN
jgi:hypothetical protein